MPFKPLWKILEVNFCFCFKFPKNSVRKTFSDIITKTSGLNLQVWLPNNNWLLFSAGLRKLQKNNFWTFWDCSTSSNICAVIARYFKMCLTKSQVVDTNIFFEIVVLFHQKFFQTDASWSTIFLTVFFSVLNQPNKWSNILRKSSSQQLVS